MLKRFFAAVNQLIGNTAELAATVREVNTTLRDRLGLDALPPADAPRLITTPPVELPASPDVKDAADAPAVETNGHARPKAGRRR